MAYRTATFDGVASFEGRRAAPGTGRRVLRTVTAHVAMAVGAVATVGALGTTAIFAAGWFLGSAVVTNPYIHTDAPAGPGRLALASIDPAATSTGRAGFETAWARTQTSRQDFARPLIVEVPESAPKPAIAAAPAPAPVQVARLAPPKAAPIPLPHARPAIPQQELPRQEQPHQELARAPVEAPAAKAPAEKPAAEKPPVQVAVAAPPPAAAPEKRVAPQAAPEKDLPLSDADSRTAVYDITASTVYMPNGQKLEAHSGLYDKMDDPRFVHVRMRGPTPPNVYELTMREQLFHGVRAIRLNPVDNKKMFGRDGMLAHTYMLGPNGQSNGCVSFKNYEKFLQAFLRGEVDRLVVVGDLGNMSWREAARTGRGPVKRYASYEPTFKPVEREERGAGTW